MGVPIEEYERCFQRRIIYRRKSEPKGEYLEGQGRKKGQGLINVDVKKIKAW